MNFLTRSWQPIMQGNVFFLNQSAQSLTGRTAEGESLPVCSEILRMDEDDMQGSLIEQCLDKGALNGVPAHLRNDGGEWVPVFLTAQLST